MRSFVIFLIGALIAVAGVSFAMVQLGVPAMWIGVTVAVVAGVAIASGAGLARKDKQAEAAAGGERRRSS